MVGGGLWWERICGEGSVHTDQNGEGCAVIGYFPLHLTGARLLFRSICVPEPVLVHAGPVTHWSRPTLSSHTGLYVG